jgi:hypothetical protein
MSLVACPNCQRKLQVPDAGPRRQVRCPSCQTLFLASAAERVDRGDASRRAPIDVAPDRAETEPEPDDAGWEEADEVEAETPPPRTRRSEEPEDREPDGPAVTEPARTQLGLWLAIGVLAGAVVLVGMWMLR